MAIASNEELFKLIRFCYVRRKKGDKKDMANEKTKEVMIDENTMYDPEILWDIVVDVMYHVAMDEAEALLGLMMAVYKYETYAEFINDFRNEGIKWFSETGKGYQVSDFWKKLIEEKKEELMYDENADKLS